MSDLTIKHSRARPGRFRVLRRLDNGRTCPQGIVDIVEARRLISEGAIDAAGIAAVVAAAGTPEAPRVHSLKGNAAIKIGDLLAPRRKRG